MGDYEDRLFVKIANNGIGPLIIKKIRVPGAQDADRSLIYQMPELHPKVMWTNFVEDTAERSIPPGSELVVLDLDSGSSDSQEQYMLSPD